MFIEQFVEEKGVDMLLYWIKNESTTNEDEEARQASLSILLTACRSSKQPLEHPGLIPSLMGE